MLKGSKTEINQNHDVANFFTACGQVGKRGTRRRGRRNDYPIPRANSEEAGYIVSDAEGNAERKRPYVYQNDMSYNLVEDGEKYADLQ